MTETQPRTAAIYARISKDVDEDGLAVERQLADCHAEAKRRGWVVPDSLVYVEDPKSATNRRTKREQYEALVADYKAGQFDALICYDLDRLTRQPKQLEDWIDAAEDRGLALVTANGEADLSTDGGRMYARIKVAVARAEVERKGVRQRRANEQRASSGGHYARVLPYGYLKGPKGSAMVKDGAVSAALEAGWRMVLEGRSVRDVADYWTAQGLKPRRSEAWNLASVHKILTNPVYAGILVRNGEALDVATDWEAYLTRDEHERVKATLTSGLNHGTKTRTPSETYLLSGILKCSCGLHMSGRKRGDGTPLYSCYGRAAGTCTRIVQVAHADEVVRSYVIGALSHMSPERVLDPAIVARQRELTAILASVSAQRTKVKEDKRASIDTRLALLGDLDEQHAATVEEIQRLTARDALGQVLAQVIPWHSEGVISMRDAAESRRITGEAFDALAVSQKRRVIEALGVYVQRTWGAGKRATVAIYSKDPRTGEVSSNTIDEDPHIF